MNMNKEQAPQILRFHPEDEAEIHLKDYLIIFKRRWWTIALVFVIVVSLTAVYLKKTPKQYEAKAVIKLPSSGGRIGMLSALDAIMPMGVSSELATEIEKIKGKELTGKVIKKLEFDKKAENSNLNWRQIVSRFQAMLRVGKKGQASLIEISVTSRSPAEAKDIANAVADEYIQLSKNSSQKIWDNLINQMEAKLSETKNDLEKSRLLLHEYEAKEGITTAFSPLLVGGGLSKEGYGTQYSIPEIPQAVAALKTSIMQMEIRLGEMKKYRPDANPDVINLANQIAESKQRLQKEESEAVEKYNKQFGLTNIAAKVIFNQQVYTTLVAKQEELKAQYIMQKGAPEILENADEPLRSSKPNKVSILIASMFMSLFAGAGLSLVREFLNGSVYTPEDVKKIMGVPVLGKIPRIRTRRIHKRADDQLLITHSDKTSHRNVWIRELYRESYRMLRMEIISSLLMSANRENTPQNHQSSVLPSIHSGNRDDGTSLPLLGGTSLPLLGGTRNVYGWTLLVTSSVPEEGRSIIAANLAISIAQTKRKVLLVELENSDTSLNSLFELDDKGLIDILQNAALDDVIRKTFVEGLYVIASGDQSKQQELSALLISPNMDSFIKLAKEHFDFVIFDSTPITLASESIALGSKVDGVIFVTKLGYTRKNDVIKAKQLMQESGMIVLGALANCAKSERKYRKYYSNRAIHSVQTNIGKGQL